MDQRGRTVATQRIRDYRDLMVWQRSVELTVACYQVAKKLGPGERFGLASQLQRAGASVCANIAEGHGRGSRREFAHFVSIARGSLMEVGAYLALIERLRMLNGPDLKGALDLTNEMSRMISGLLGALRNPSALPRVPDRR